MEQKHQLRAGRPFVCWIQNLEWCLAWSLACKQYKITPLQFSLNIRKYKENCLEVSSTLKSRYNYFIGHPGLLGKCPSILPHLPLLGPSSLCTPSRPHLPLSPTPGLGKLCMALTRERLYCAHTSASPHSGSLRHRKYHICLCDPPLGVYWCAVNILFDRCICLAERLFSLKTLR